MPLAISRRRRSETGPVRVRLAMEHLSGAWLKLGQALALRFDILPRAYCEELFELLDRVPPFPYAAVQQQVRESLGADPAELFASFVEEPFASASVGQVHDAVLTSGEPVAVKVQRPGIGATMRADIALMRVLALIAEWMPFINAPGLRHAVEEFASWTHEELDYRVEARHGRLMRKNAAGDPLQKVPRVYSSLSSARVLTMERLQGISLSDALHSDGQREGAMFFDADVVAAHLAWNLLNQIYIDGVFHADQHPANLLVLPGDVIGYVDFGIVGRMSSAIRTSSTKFAFLLFAGEAEQATDEFLLWLEPSRSTNMKAARAELVGLMQDYYLAFDSREARAAYRREGASLEVRMLDAIRLHRLALKPPFVVYVKAISTVSAVVDRLAPEFDLRAYENTFFARMRQQELEAAFAPQHLIEMGVGFGRKLDGALTALADFGASSRDVADDVRKARTWIQRFAVPAIGGVLVLVVLAVVGLHRGQSALIISLAVGVLIVLVVSLIGITYHARNLPQERILRAPPQGDLEDR